MDLQCGQIHIILQWFDMKLWTHGFVNGIGILTQIGEWNESNRYDNEKKNTNDKKNANDIVSLWHTATNYSVYVSQMISYERRENDQFRNKGNEIKWQIQMLVFTLWFQCNNNSLSLTTFFTYKMPFSFGRLHPFLFIWNFAFNDRARKRKICQKK